MKKLLIISLVILSSSLKAQVLRHVAPHISDLSDYSQLDVGELVITNNSLAINTQDGLNLLNSLGEIDRSIPMISSSIILESGISKKSMIIEKGKVKIGGSVYENQTRTYCSSSNGQGVGGYDGSADPFTNSTFAYLYIVPHLNGVNFGCVLSLSSTGVSQTISDVSLLVGVSFKDVTDLGVTSSPAYSIYNDEVVGIIKNTIFPVTSIQKNANCQVITFSGLPEHVEYLDFDIRHVMMEGQFQSLAIFNKSDCSASSKIFDFEIYWYTDFFAQIPSTFLNNKQLWIKGVMNGTATVTPIIFKPTISRMKFRRKLFKQGN